MICSMLITALDKCTAPQTRFHSKFTACMHTLALYIMFWYYVRGQKLDITLYNLVKFVKIIIYTDTKFIDFAHCKSQSRNNEIKLSVVHVL